MYFFLPLLLIFIEHKVGRVCSKRVENMANVNQQIMISPFNTRTNFLSGEKLVRLVVIYFESVNKGWSYDYKMNIRREA